MGGLEVLHPFARSWATPLILPPSPPLSPSPTSSFRPIATDVSGMMAVAQAPCLRLYSQPSFPSFPSTPVQVMRQVSVPVFAMTSPTTSFPSTPRVAFRDFQPGSRVTVTTSADSPRNTIKRDVVPPTPPAPNLPVKIRIATPLLKRRDSLPVNSENRMSESIPSMPTLLRSKGAAAKKHLELKSAKAEEIRSWERKWREAAAEHKRAEAERLRLEAERQRAQLQQKNGSALRRQTEQRRESLAEDLRRLAEAKRRVRREEAEEVERKRAEAQRSRQEAASRRLHRKLLLVEEKHRLAEEARRVVEEGRRRRFNGDAGKGKAETARGRRFSEIHPRPNATPAAGARRRAKSADVDGEAERRAEEERQRLEEEEAERRRLRWEQLQRLAVESKRRIESAGCAWHVVLNVTKEATLIEVKQAFRDLALLHHPDKGLESCNETFRIVRGAYQRALAFFQEKDKVPPS